MNFLKKFINNICSVQKFHSKSHMTGAVSSSLSKSNSLKIFSSSLNIICINFGFKVKPKVPHERK